MSKPNNGQLTTFSAGTTIQGNVVADNDTRVAGTLKGNLETSGHLIVEQSGAIEGNIKASAATIAGRILGNLEVTDKLILETKSSVEGDISTKALVIEDGAIFNGKCISTGGRTH